jgi:Trypsin-like peptidase domain
MKSLCLSLAIFFPLVGTSIAQSGVETEKDPDILHSMRRSTVSIGIRVDIGGVQKFLTAGSAVIVSLDATHNCLLTAKHVLVDPEKGYRPTVVYVRLPKDTPQVQEDLGMALPLYDGHGKPLWRGADGADLAVAPVPNLGDAKDVHSVSITNFGGNEDLFQGAPVVVFGYPELLGPDYQTTPIARNGIVAWTNPEGPLTHTFLVDANIFNGNSGGPVFHIPNGINRKGQIGVGGPINLIGIVSKDAGEEASVHAGNDPLSETNNQTGIVTPFTAKVLNIGGIGIIEPISKAKTLVLDFIDPYRTIVPRPPTNP